MERKIGLALILLLLLTPILFANVANAQLYAREIDVTPMYNGNVLIFEVPISYIGVFQGLYISSSPDCSTKLPTYSYVTQDSVIVMVNGSWQANTTYRLYICYGNIYYPNNPIGNESMHTISLEYVTDEHTHNIPGTEYITLGFSTTDITLWDNGTIHVVDMNVTVSVYSYGYAITTYILCDGNPVASHTTPSYTSQSFTLTASNIDCSNIILRFQGSGYYYYYIYGGVIVYRPWEKRYNMTALNVTGAYIRATAEGGKAVVNYSSVHLEDIQLNVVCAAGGCLTGTYYQSGIGNVTIGVSGYGWNVSATAWFDVWSFNGTIGTVEYIGPQTIIQEQTGGGGGAGGNVSLGNITVNVEVESRTWEATYVIGSLILFAVGLILISHTLFYATEWTIIPGAILQLISILVAAYSNHIELIRIIMVISAVTVFAAAVRLALRYTKLERVR